MGNVKFLHTPIKKREYKTKNNPEDLKSMADGWTDRQMDGHTDRRIKSPHRRLKMLIKINQTHSN